MVGRRGRQILFAAVGVATALGACGCSVARRFGASSSDPDSGLIHAGSYYKDGDVEVGAVPSWDTWAGPGGKNLQSDGAAATALPAQALPCGGATPKPDASCCPPGEAWDKAAVACLPVTLAECPDAATCRPWACVGGQTSDGKTCTPTADNQLSCVYTGHVCSPPEIAGAAMCRAGQWAADSSAKPTCIEAGSDVVLPGGAVVPADGTLPKLAAPAALVPADLVASDFAPPAVTPPQWCGTYVKVPCPGGLPQCEVGSFIDGDGKPYCSPIAGGLPAWCPQGFTATGSGVPVCAADVADCGTDPWGGVAETGNNVFVDGAFKGTPQGTKAAPFATLNDALGKLAGKVPPSAIIAVANGVYTLPPNATVVPKNVTVRGRCAASVHLIGNVTGNGAFVEVEGALERVTVLDGPIAVIVKAGGLVARARVQGGNYAGIRMLGGTVQDVVVEPASRGILMDGKGGTGSLLRVRVHGAKERGVVVAGGFTATLTDIAITATDAVASSCGYGLLLAEGSKTTASGVRIDGSRCAGLAAFDAGTVGTVDTAWIAGTLLDKADGTGGHGVLVSGAAQLTVNHAVVDGNRTVGVLAFGAGSQLLATNLTVQNTLGDDGKTGQGDGLRVQNGATAQVTGFAAKSNHNRGMACDGAGSQLTVTAALISDTQSTTIGDKQSQTPPAVVRGEGMAVENGCVAVVQGVRMHGNRSAGLIVAGKGAQLNGGGVVISAMQPQQGDKKKGFGALIVDGGQAQLTDLHIDTALTAGMWIADAGSAATIGTLKIAHTLPQTDNFGGRGIQVGAGAVLKVTGPLQLFGNRDLAVVVDGPGAQAVLGNGKDPAWIANTLPRSDNWAGRGVQVQAGGSAQLTHVHVVGGSEAGIVATGAGSHLDATDTFVTNILPRPYDQQFGRCLVFENGASAMLHGVTVAGCSDAGVFVHGAKLTGDDLTVAHITSGPKLTGDSKLPNGLHGRGVVAQGGAQLTLQRLRISDCTEVGLSAAATTDKATVVQLRDVVIDGTQPEALAQAAGRGIDLSRGATLVVAGALITGNREAAIVAGGPGTTLIARNLWVTKTQPDAVSGLRGAALHASDGAVVSLVGARLTGNRDAAVVLSGVQASLAGVAVDNTLSNGDGTGGLGMAVQSKTKLMAHGMRLTGNQGAALLTWASTLTLFRVALVQTGLAKLAGVPTPSGDGLQALAESVIVWSDGLVALAKRAGVLVDSALVTLTGVRVAGNSFGWSVQNEGKVVPQSVAVQANEQNVWTGAALPTIAPITPLVVRFQLEPLTY